MVAGKIPALQEFVARRLVTRDHAPHEIAREQQRDSWNKTVQTFAKGMRVANVGEGGVVRQESFRNRVALQTHPLDRETPCILSWQRVEIPADRKTFLKLRVTHHPHGDWQLRVRVGDQVIEEAMVGSTTVGPDEWLNLSVDLSDFAGRQVPLSIENRANNWHNEWAYWNQIEIVHE